MSRRKYTEKMVKEALKGSSGLTDAALRLARLYAEATGEKLEAPINHQRMSALKKYFKIKTKRIVSAKLELDTLQNNALQYPCY